MPQSNAGSRLTATSRRQARRPFFGAIDCVLVEEGGDFEFDGAIDRLHAEAAWTWLTRDIAPDLIDPEADDREPAALAALDALLPELLERIRQALAAVAVSRESERRLVIQLGGEDYARRLPVVVNALKCRNLLGKAQAFGRATNGMPDEAALAAALQAMPLSDAAVAALVMQAAVGQVAYPQRLTTAMIRITGAATESAIASAGFVPLVDALLAHAQNQIPAMIQVGPFADIDLACRAIDRFHRLVRAVNGYVELSRHGRWTATIGRLIKSASDRIEPRLRDVLMAVNTALRQPAGAADRLDPDQLLMALNGVYILAAVRDARDSLALNAVFDQVWAQVGQALEIHIERALGQFRREPTDEIAAARLDAAIRMAELRFNGDYADVLRRARDSAVKP